MGGRAGPPAISRAPVRALGAAGNPRVCFADMRGSDLQTSGADADADTLFRHAVERAPEAIWIFDGGKLAYVNPALVRMLGFPDAETLLAQEPAAMIHPDDRAELFWRARRMLETGETLGPHEYRAVRRDGRTILVEVHSMPLDLDGAPHLLSFGRDVGARRAMEARLVQADRLAALGATAAGIAHEINNPLAFALLAAEEATRRLDRHGAPPGLREALVECLDDVQEGIRRVADIVRELRVFARPTDETRAPVLLADVVKAAARFAHNEIRHRARFVTELGSAGPVEGLGARLEQVFLNLLVHAAQRLPGARSQGNEIRVRLFEDGDEVVTEISDNGPGIPADHLPRVFDPFFSSKSGGMDLAISRDIVEAHGGALEVESAAGVGTTLRVRLPAAARAAVGAATPPGRARTMPGRARVLVVDDEANIGRVLRASLSRYDVACAGSAAGALDHLADAPVDAPVDAIVCDVMMPEVTGVELYAAVAERWPALAARFVFMTGGTLTQAARAFLGATKSPVLEKPFGTAALVAALEGVLAARAGAEATGARAAPGPEGG
jgi:PAS domain S-box-containing protein